jgi:HK97 family phage major capsid protein
MNIAVLERELEQKQTTAKALLTKHSQAAEKRGDELTDDERKEVQGALDEAKIVKAKLDRAKGDQSLQAEIDALLGEQDRRRVSAAEAAKEQTGRERRSLGEQFVSNEEFRQWSERTKGRKKANGTMWASPVITLHPHGETLTTESGSPGSGGDLIVPDYRPGILPLLFRRLTVADLIAPGTTDSNAIIYMKESLFDNNADTVPEGTTKPESSLRFDQESDLVHTIAHWLPVTEQMLEDVPAIRSYINARLRLGVQLAEEDKLVNGAASPAEITGILNRTGLRAAEAGGSGAQANAEAVFRQIFGIFTDSFVMPTGIVMNPTNWQTIQLMKDSQNQYMGAGPWAPPQARTLWGLPVVVTPVIAASTALVGDFAGSAQIFRKGGIDVQATNSHSDYFIKNLVAIRAEERLALAVYRPSAFGTVTGLD